jgi:hypothetical protein
LISVCLAWGLPASLPAAEVSLRASVDKDVISRIGDRLIYTLTVEGATDGEPELPPLEGFQVLRTTVSTHVSVLNGQATSSKSWNYVLVPTLAEEEKEVEIPSAHLRHGGKTYASNSLRVRIVKASVAPPPSSPDGGTAPETARAQPAGANRPLFIETDVDKKEVFEGEQVTLSFRLFSYRLQLANIQYTPPPTVGFLEESVSGQKNFERVVAGVPYVVNELKSAIFPLRAGELAVGSAELKGDVLVPGRRGGRSLIDDFFADDFFSPFDFERRPFSLRSDPITVLVKPLPAEGRPADFSGAVGRFAMKAEASPRRVKAGEPITLTVSITGEGNVDSARMAVFRPGEAFKTYNPEVETRKKAEGDRLGGEKIFKQVVIPLKEGEQALSAVEFSWFDPSAGVYRVEKSEPIAIMVDPAPAEGPAMLVEAAPAGNGKTGIALLQKDILYIKDNPGELVHSRRSFYRNGWYWAAHLLPALLILATARFQSQRERLRSDRVYARKVRASRTARARFREAARLLKAGETAKFYAAAHRAMICYLGDKLGLPSGAVDCESVAPRIEKAGLPPEFLADVQDAFNVCDRARYAPSASSEGMADFLEKVEGIVDRLEKVKIR